MPRITRARASFPQRPHRWSIVLAFLLVYLSWGTTYLAIRTGVHAYHLPPGLFGGLRVCVAGLLLLGFLGLRGEPLRLPRRDFLWVSLTGVLLFVGGNGLITLAMGRIPSGVASVLVATTPLLIALMETLLPWGERLTLRGWLGLMAGFGGVVVLLAPDVEHAAGLVRDLSPFLALASASFWALGSLMVRYRKFSGSHLAAAAYQMFVGGGCLALIGWVAGESRTVDPQWFAPGALFAFLYLLIVGSLVGFVAYNWLLGHVPAAKVGTYAYVNPLIAVIVGWLLGGEELTGRILGGMAIILSGVALVRSTASRSEALLDSAENVPGVGPRQDEGRGAMEAAPSCRGDA